MEWKIIPKMFFGTPEMDYRLFDWFREINDPDCNPEAGREEYENLIAGYRLNRAELNVVIGYD